MDAQVEKFEVRNRWTNAVQFTAEITCAPDASMSLKFGLAVRWAVKSGANLRDAYLSDANLSDANLRGANLRGAYLSDANLSGVPKIENIHQAVYAAASQPGALDMSDWHICGTTHCRAGWVTTLAGEAGKELEERIGTAAAATLIYLASDPKIERLPDFYCNNDEALADMRRLAQAEAA